MEGNVTLAQELMFEGKLCFYKTDYKFGKKYRYYIIKFRLIFPSAFYLSFDSEHTEREILDYLNTALCAGYITEDERDTAVQILTPVA